MAVQDPTFHERVLDLANLVLVCMAGPEAQHSLASAVDPERDQVFPTSPLLGGVVLLVVFVTSSSTVRQAWSSGNGPRCQYHHVVSFMVHVGGLGQGCYGACSIECCAVHPPACCNRG